MMVPSPSVSGVLNCVAKSATSWGGLLEAESSSFIFRGFDAEITSATWDLERPKEKGPGESKIQLRAGVSLEEFSA